MRIQVLLLPLTGLFLFLSACTSHHTTTSYWNRAAGIRKEQGTAYFVTGKDGAAKEIRDGKWTTWHRNTKKHTEVHFKDGVPVGEIRIWYPDGKLKYRANYDEDGLLDGIISFYTQDGQLKTYTVSHGTGTVYSYYDDGTLKSEIVYRQGKIQGKARYFAPDGKLLHEEDNSQ